MPGKGGDSGAQASLRINLDLVKNLATLVPVVHILAACFFLFGYCLGFGSHIIAFVTISDVFAVSIRAIGQVYLFTAWPLLVFLVFRRKCENDSGNLGLYVFLLAIVTLILVIVLGSGLFSQDPRTPREWGSLVALGFIVSAVLAGLFFDWPKLMLERQYAVQASVVTGLSVILVFSLALGFNKGAIDNGRKYAQAKDSYSRCADASRVIIRPIGSYFLALDNNDLWLLVDEECKPRFALGSAGDSALISGRAGRRPPTGTNERLRIKPATSSAAP